MSVFHGDGTVDRRFRVQSEARSINGKVVTRWVALFCDTDRIVVGAETADEAWKLARDWNHFRKSGTR